MGNQLILRSPNDGTTIAKRPRISSESMHAVVSKATDAQSSWAHTSIHNRAKYCHKAIDWFIDNQQQIAEEICLQMGRPIRYASGEIQGLEERARYMIDIAKTALSDIKVKKERGYTRFIRPTPLGTVMVIAPWNYPYLTAVNSIIPAIMAGNAVILKHSAQTFLCAERFAQAFESAGLPQGVFQYLHIDHEQTADLVRHKNINFISFTGSVEGGKAIEQAAAGLFKPISLELGGKDAAYVREDADIQYTVNNLVDGVFFNSGQSCCGIERIYIHSSVYEDFINQFIQQVKSLTLGHGLDKTTSLGPMITIEAANFAREQILRAKEQGATLNILSSDFDTQGLPANYLAPQVLTNVTHQMSIMMEENFAPLVGIIKVENDEEALSYINDSYYGLTTSIWSRDSSLAIYLGNQINVGTVFLNRCDYLDPALPWVGVKNSGKGCSLSYLAYNQLTRPKSFNLKLLVDS